MFQDVIPVKQKAILKNNQRIQANADFDNKMPIYGIWKISLPMMYLFSTTPVSVLEALSALV